MLMFVCTQGVGVTVGAYIAGVEALAGIATTDTGIAACLAHGVPAALVTLAQRVLTGRCMGCEWGVRFTAEWWGSTGIKD